VQVWCRSGHLPVRRNDLCKNLQTDGRRDDGRRAIALAHSWNELKMIISALVHCHSITLDSEALSDYRYTIGPEQLADVIVAT